MNSKEKNELIFFGSTGFAFFNLHFILDRMPENPNFCIYLLIGSWVINSMLLIASSTLILKEKQLLEWQENFFNVFPLLLLIINFGLLLFWTAGGWIAALYVIGLIIIGWLLSKALY